MLTDARQCSLRKGCNSAICCSNSLEVVPLSATSFHTRLVAAVTENF